MSYQLFKQFKKQVVLNSSKIDCTKNLRKINEGNLLMNMKENFKN